MKFNGQEVRLGLNKGVQNPKRYDLLLKNTFELPAPPPHVDWTKGQKNWGMMKNDELGDCTAAGVGHAFQVWTNVAHGREWTPTDQQVVDFYSHTTGYNRLDPHSDQGGDEPTVLNWLEKNGYFGFTVDGYGTMPDVHDLNKAKQLIEAFGGLYIGFDVPDGIAEAPGSVWNNPPDGQIVGGHCVFVPGYLANGTFIVITWGEIVYMTPAFWHAYVTEAHAILAGAWFNAGKCPSGFDRGALRQEVKALQ